MDRSVQMRRLFVGAVALGTVMPVVARADAAIVLSDVAKIKGVGTPGAAVGSYAISTTACALRSDTEPVVTCSLTGQLTVSSAGVGSLTATISSTDGQVQFGATVTPSGPTTFAIKGKGTETEQDPGQPPVTYPAVVKGSVKVTMQPSGAFVFVGVLKVFEQSTSP